MRSAHSPPRTLGPTMCTTDSSSALSSLCTRAPVLQWESLHCLRTQCGCCCPAKIEKVPPETESFLSKISTFQVESRNLSRMRTYRCGSLCRYSWNAVRTPGAPRRISLPQGRCNAARARCPCSAVPFFFLLLHECRAPSVVRGSSPSVGVSVVISWATYAPGGHKSPTVCCCFWQRSNILPLLQYYRSRIEKWARRGPPPPSPKDALEGKVPQRRLEERLDRRLEEVAKAVGGGYCRLQMPLKPALAVTGTVPGHRLGALERGGGGVPPPLSNASLLSPPHRMWRASVIHSFGGDPEETTSEDQCSDVLHLYTPPPRACSAHFTRQFASSFLPTPL